MAARPHQMIISFGCSYQEFLDAEESNSIFGISHFLSLLITILIAWLLFVRQSLMWIKKRSAWVELEFGILKPYVCKAFFDATVVPMELINVREHGRAPSLNFKSMWESKLILEEDHLVEIAKAA